MGISGLIKQQTCTTSTEGAQGRNLSRIWSESLVRLSFSKPHLNFLEFLLRSPYLEMESLGPTHIFRALFPSVFLVQIVDYSLHWRTYWKKKKIITFSNFPDTFHVIKHFIYINPLNALGSRGLRDLPKGHRMETPRTHIQVFFWLLSSCNFPQQFTTQLPALWPLRQWPGGQFLSNMISQFWPGISYFK